MQGTTRIPLLIASSIVLLVLLSSAVYIVDETQQVIITQFGEPVGDPITTPGLKIKMPLIQAAHFFDKRFLEWDGDANQVPTRDKRFIWVDTYARWRISNARTYLERLRGDENTAQSRLDDILGEKERDLQEIQSKAYRQAQETRGVGDAEATRIYADAYNRDSSFYAFTKSMETLERTIDPNTLLILTTEGELFRYIDKPQ